MPPVAHASTSSLAASPTTVQADGTSTSTLTATIRDSGGAPLSGQSVSIASNRGNYDTILPASATTSASGVATFSVKSTVIGMATFTATVADNGSGPVTVSQTASVNFVPALLDLSVPIDMVERALPSLAGSAAVFTRSQTSLNTMDYDGTVSYSFEIVAKNADSANKTVRLIDSVGNEKASITIPAGNTSLVRYAVGFAPAGGAGVYKISLDPTLSAAQLLVSTARIIVTQAGASKTRIYYPLMSYSTSPGSSGTDGLGYTSQSNSATYGQPNPANFLVWRKDATAYNGLDGTTPWTFEALLSKVSSNASIALFNRTKGTPVSGIELTNSAASNILMSTSFADGTDQFFDSDEYEVKVRSVTDTMASRYIKAGLWLKLANFTKAQVFHRVMRLELPSAGATSSVDGARSLINLSAYSNPTVFFQALGRLTSGPGGSAVLQTCGTNDSGTSCTNVGGSALTFDSTLLENKRSPALSITSGDRFIGTVSSDPGSTYENRSSFIVIDFSH